MMFLHMPVPPLMAPPGSTIEVALSRPAMNVMLLDELNFQHYQRGLPFVFHSGGNVLNAVVAELLVPPLATPQWHVIVDTGGAPGPVAATYRVLPPA